MRAAQEWGLTPDEWFERPRHERQTMVGYVNVAKIVEIVSAYDARPKPKPGGKP